MTDDTLAKECEKLGFDWGLTKQETYALLAFARAQQAKGLREAADTLRQYADVCRGGILSERKATLTIMSEQLEAQATAREQGHGQ